MIKKRRDIYSLFGVLILIILIISILLVKLMDNKKKIKNDNITTPSNNQSTNVGNENLFTDLNRLSAWIVYWDLDVDEEMKILDKKLSSLSYFAANFNEENQLVIPDKLIEYYNESKSYNFKKYITIVNDVVYDNGKSTLKDKDILSKVLSDEVSRTNHVDEIIELAKRYDFDGIEIDYEQIKDDLDLWYNFMLFINELYESANSNGLDIRIILEPNVPFDKVDFVKGPTYVMMCYNLHGPFSEPGVKSNKKFIEDLIEKMEKIDSNKEFAIATGGFDWGKDGKTNSVSELEAKKILSEYNVEVQRDSDSKYLYFYYTDKKNVKHEVWYADKITLEYLFNVVIESGYDFSLWRLGGNLFH